jgi:four helix bundle protein
MLSKISIALQELEETRYWMELLVEAGLVRGERLKDLLKEADELKAILFSSARKIKSLGNRSASMSIVH